MNIVAGVAPTLPARRNAGGGMGTDFDCDGGLVAHTLRGDGFDASEDGTGRGTPLTVSYCLNAKGGGGATGRGVGDAASYYRSCLRCRCNDQCIHW